MPEVMLFIDGGWYSAEGFADAIIEAVNHAEEWSGEGKRERADDEQNYQLRKRLIEALTLKP